MFKSYEQFKSITKSVYDALRSDPSMKLSAFRQLFCTGAGYANPQSLKASFQCPVDPNPMMLVGDELADLFNTSYVVDELGAPKELSINGDDAIITSSGNEEGGDEFWFLLDEMRGVLYDGVLMVYIGTEYEGKYTVYKRHQQPEISSNEAVIVFVNGESDMGFYLNGQSLGNADNKAGDDFYPIVLAVKGVMLALNCHVEIVGIELDDGEWNWDMIPARLSSKDGVTTMETINGESHWFFEKYAY
jgi:hypothetical protein